MDAAQATRSTMSTAGTESGKSLEGCYKKAVFEEGAFIVWNLHKYIL